MRTATRGALVLALGASSLAAVIACGARDTSGRSEQPLAYWNGDRFWTQNGHQVPICFVTAQQDPGVLPNPAQADARVAFRDALERSWPSVAWIDVSGFVDCPSTGSTRYLRYALTGGMRGVANMGMNGLQQIANANFPMGSDPFDGRLTLPLPDGGTQPNPGWNISYVGNGSDVIGTNSYGLLVVHETGHSLGWVHEHDSPANVTADGGPVLCTQGEPSGNSALTQADPQSVMAWSYCSNNNRGLTSFDIDGTIQIYGQRPESADSDGDGIKDFQDDCPYVYDGSQADSNRDAELTIATRDNGWDGSWIWNGIVWVHRLEGHVPLQDDPAFYKARWRSWYKGDACDTTAVTATINRPYSSHLASEPGCYHVFVGGIHMKTFAASEMCPPRIDDGQLDHDSYVSSKTGFADSAGGWSQPAACKCVTPNDKWTCTQPAWGNCQFARDTDFPTSQDTQWLRMTTEVFSGGYWDLYFGLYAPTLFQPPVPGYTPSTTSTFWNPFRASQYALQDTVRMGLGAGALQVPAVLWTHVQDGPILQGTDPTNLRNNYLGVSATKYPGTIFHWVPPFAPKWKPHKWFKKLVGQSWGPVRYMAVTRDERGEGVVIEQESGVLDEVTGRYSASALTALGSVATGTQEILVADDHVANAGPTSSPSVLVVDAGTTRIRGALIAGSAAVDYVSAPELPAQSSGVLRAYAAEAGKLFSLEGASLVARDVAAALGGNATATSTVITGAMPESPQAAVWVPGRSALLVVDQAGAIERQMRLLSIDAATGVSTVLWQLMPTPQEMLPTAFLSLDGFGRLVLSMGFSDGTYEAISLRTSDGQPVRSIQGIGVLHDAVTSDGSGFTVPLTQTPTETQPNVNASFVPRTGSSAGFCAAVHFQEMVGDQSGMALGKPSDCW